MGGLPKPVDRRSILSSQFNGYSVDMAAESTVAKIMREDKCPMG
jgi:hypothetical protein